MVWLGEMVEEEEEVKWVKHYCSLHDILVVGDGDFSFSLSLANGFGSAANIVATSFDSCDMVIAKYSKAGWNLDRLKRMGGTVLHSVDATKMKLHADLRMHKFDRIVFNFPHAGFKGKEDHPRLINLHRRLVQGFFKNASSMLRAGGEVHISHKASKPFTYWNLEELAATSSLVLFQSSEFDIGDYPGYSNKRGDGSRCDQTFPLGKCLTYKFLFSRKKMDAPLMPSYLGHHVPPPLMEIGRPTQRFIFGSGTGRNFFGDDQGSLHITPSSCASNWWSGAWVGGIVQPPLPPPPVLRPPLPLSLAPLTPPPPPPLVRRPPLPLSPAPLTPPPPPPCRMQIPVARGREEYLLCSREVENPWNHRGERLFWESSCGGRGYRF